MNLYTPSPYQSFVPKCIWSLYQHRWDAHINLIYSHESNECIIIISLYRTCRSNQQIANIIYICPCPWTIDNDGIIIYMHIYASFHSLQISTSIWNVLMNFWGQQQHQQQWTKVNWCVTNKFDWMKIEIFFSTYLRWKKKLSVKNRNSWSLTQKHSTKFGIFFSFSQ